MFLDYTPEQDALRKELRAYFAEGLPFGMQLTGRPGTEALVLRAGAAYEAATGP